MEVLAAILHMRLLCEAKVKETEEEVGLVLAWKLRMIQIGSRGWGWGRSWRTVGMALARGNKSRARKRRSRVYMLVVWDVDGFWVGPEGYKYQCSSG
jgi:hypothetical protein